MRANIAILDWDNDSDNLLSLTNLLSQAHQSSKYTIYARSLSSSNCAYSFSALIDSQKIGAVSGLPIGICQSNQKNCGQENASFIGSTTFQAGACTLVSLQNVPLSNLAKANDWYNFEATAVYDDVQNWWR